jgi:dihydrofolate reductase
MGKLIYLLNVSLDGYVETPDHGLDWTSVDDELHEWFNDQTRQLDASLYGRGLYELMSDYWPTAQSDPSATAPMREFARIWLDMPKIVFSSTLQDVQWNSRLVRGDVGDELARVREEFDGDIDVGGATLAASFIRRGLVDEYRLVVHPVAIGSGTPFFPPLDSPITLRLTDTHVFRSGVTYLCYTRGSTKTKSSPLPSSDEAGEHPRREDTSLTPDR